MIIARQLGRYHLLDRLAIGGMAEIYRAKTFDSQGAEHLIAIKRVLRHLADDDDFLQMLVDEAKIATLLEHPNITKTYEFVRVMDEYFIAMEYVDGRDLRSVLDRLRSGGLAMPPEDAAYILMRVLEALHFAHHKCDGAGRELNIVHRDVSPSNVIISFEGQVKLCDFGIAKARLSRVQTRVGVIKGKVKYMSPEQAMGRPLDGRSDIFSAGSVLYELLTKQPPFQADDEMAMIFRVRDAKFIRPSRWDVMVPVPLERILRKTMARGRSGRFQTALEAANALRDYLQDSAPDYSPKLLGRRLTSLFADDISEDRKRLAHVVIQGADSQEVGTNLLAEVLGEGAAYTRFTAAPLSPQEQEARDQSALTRLHARAPSPESRLPQGVDLHDVRTEIFDAEERINRIVKRKRRRRPGADHHSEQQRETQMKTLVRKPDQLSTPPAPTVQDLHAARTRIFDTAAVEAILPRAPKGGLQASDTYVDHAPEQTATVQGQFDTQGRLLAEEEDLHSQHTRILRPEELSGKPLGPGEAATRRAGDRLPPDDTKPD